MKKGTAGPSILTDGSRIVRNQLAIGGRAARLTRLNKPSLWFVHNDDPRDRRCDASRAISAVVVDDDYLGLTASACNLRPNGREARRDECFFVIGGHNEADQHFRHYWSPFPWD